MNCMWQATCCIHHNCLMLNAQLVWCDLQTRTVPQACPQSDWSSWSLRCMCVCVCATFFLDLILFSVIATKVPDSSQDSDDVKWPRIVSVNTAQWCFTICQFNGIRESVNSETYIVRFEGEPLLLSINMCRPQLTYITLSKRQKEVASSQGHSPQATPRLYLAAVEKNQ